MAQDDDDGKSHCLPTELFAGSAKEAEQGDRSSEQLGATGDERRGAKLTQRDGKREAGTNNEAPQADRHIDLATHTARRGAEHRRRLAKGRIDGTKYWHNRSDDERGPDKSMSNRHDPP